MEAAGSNISDDNPLRYESQRLFTFANWPSHAKVSSSKIAKAGFFYTGSYLEARCLWCGIVLTTWEFGDQVMTRHRLANPECVFVKNQSNNVPLAPSPMPQSISVTSQISQAESLAESVDTSDERRLDGTPEAPGLVTDPADQSSQFLAFMASETLSDSPESRADPIDPSSSSGFESGGEDAASFLDIFYDEKIRLRTFRGWNARVVRPSELAKEGFIYSGIRDCVRCVFCAGYIGSWEPNDRPVDVHREIYPNCRFVRGIPCGNIPLTDEQRESLSDVFGEYLDDGITEAARADSSASTERFQTSFDAGMDDTGIRETSFNAITPKAPSVLTLKDASLRPGQDDDKIGVIKHSGPSRPKYAPYEARIRTFKEWPPALKQQPKELADAGFYYIGLSDQVKCFYCDGGLRNWQPEDDPWVEHSRWFSKCGFVRLVKGDEFIAKCIISRPPDAMPELPSVSHDRGQISDEDLQSMMISHEVREALSCGIDPSRIKMAIKKKWRETGSGFSASQHLIEAACREQFEQEDRVMVENTMTPSPFANLSPQTVESMASLMSPSTEESSKLGLPVAEEDTRLKSPTIPDKATISESERKDADLPTASEISTDLEKENRRLKEERTCRICMDNEIGVVFLPCGHLICCFKCAPALSDCPLCRQPIQGTVKTYMS